MEQQGWSVNHSNRFPNENHGCVRKMCLCHTLEFQFVCAQLNQLNPWDHNRPSRTIISIVCSRTNGFFITIAAIRQIESQAENTRIVQARIRFNSLTEVTRIRDLILKKSAENHT